VAAGFTGTVLRCMIMGIQGAVVVRTAEAARDGRGPAHRDAIVRQQQMAQRPVSHETLREGGSGVWGMQAAV
jgi:hypothetical protein